ncbi:hypothetical protein E2P74_10200 [Limosilactobacillus fermentum]|uniref:hypothetical protein n=1 Tax=Limosilactobacillus fermentum TaxID=1613 RepID=UPI001075C55A|nr:hypothetical protein [Limosilactobacillus fermentum]TFZ15210.1 hypothetical protein E2P74_10200 [Limosilactobacillus fermentum]
MNYQQEKQAYDDQVKRLQKIEALDKGPGKGTPAKVDAVYSLAFYNSLRTYTSSECLAAGPFDANFDQRTTINGQVDDYEIYLLDKDLDPKQKIIIVQRGTTARIINSFGVDLTFDYDCTPDTTRNLAAALAILLLEDDTTVDEALTALINPQEDETKSDDDLVKRLQKALDEGPDKGTPVKVQGVYTLAYDKVSRAYNVDSCLSAGPFEANFNDIITINEQFGDYTIYLLDKEIDPEQRIIIIQRGETARILSGYGVEYSVGTPIATRNMAAELAFFVQENKRMSDDDRVKRLQNFEALDKGPDKGTSAKVSAVFSVSYKDSWRGCYLECLAAGPFDVNFDKWTAINGQVGDYTIYVLDEKLDPEQKIIIVQRGTTARIIKCWNGGDLTFKYDCTPDTTRNLAAALAILLIDNNKTVDEALVDLINPQKDETKPDF